MRPESQVELQPARDGLLADEFQHLHIPVALGIGKTYGLNVITWNGHQERIGEIKISIGYVVVAVVADTQRQIETAEAVRGERGEIVGPEVAIVEPGFVLHIADEATCAASNGVRGLLDNWRFDVERAAVF